MKIKPRLCLKSTEEKANYVPWNKKCFQLTLKTGEMVETRTVTGHGYVTLGTHYYYLLGDTASYQLYSPTVD